MFSGGRTLEAIEEICDAEGDLPVDALEGVSSLLDKSLLRQEEGPEDEPRFVMLETIHEYAREKLQESGEAEEVERAARRLLPGAGRGGRAGARGSGAGTWLERLEAEHDNLRAALSWCSKRARRSRRCHWRARCGGSGECGATSAKDGAGWRKGCRGEMPLRPASGRGLCSFLGTWT